MKETFEVRDKLAHGKTWVGKKRYLDDGIAMGDDSFPDWLNFCLIESRAAKAIRDARILIGELLQKAGYPDIDLYRMGRSEYHEVTGPAQKAVWKVKGT